VGAIELTVEERFHIVPMLFDINHQYFFVGISLCQIRNEQGELLRTIQVTGVLLNEGTNWN